MAAASVGARGWPERAELLPVGHLWRRPPWPSSAGRRIGVLPLTSEPPRVIENEPAGRPRTHPMEMMAGSGGGRGGRWSPAGVGREEGDAHPVILARIGTARRGWAREDGRGEDEMWWRGAGSDRRCGMGHMRRRKDRRRKAED